jgi:hypothetical protein
MRLPPLTGPNAWEALWTIVCIVVVLIAIGSIIRYAVKGLYTGEYPKAWAARHKITFHSGEVLIAILTAVIWYKAYEELRPLIGTVLSQETINPKISNILAGSVLLPSLFWYNYEAARWQSDAGLWGARIWFAIAFVYAVAILPGTLWR